MVHLPCNNHFTNVSIVLAFALTCGQYWPLQVQHYWWIMFSKTRGPSLVEMLLMITEIWQKIIPEILGYLCKLWSCDIKLPLNLTRLTELTRSKQLVHELQVSYVCTYKISYYLPVMFTNWSRKFKFEMWNLMEIWPNFKCCRFGRFLVSDGPLAAKYHVITENYSLGNIFHSSVDMIGKESIYITLIN